MLAPATAEVILSKPASTAKQQLHQLALNHLPTNFSQGNEDATRGFLGAFPTAQIKQPDGTLIWDNEQFSFIHGNAPETVNPSLWEQEKLNKKLLELLDTQNKFLKIDYSIVSQQVILGSLIESNGTFFLMAVALPKIEVDGKSIFGMSPQSPLGELFMGKKVQETVIFNKVSYKIESIF
jgi:hypothetical protein